MRIIAFLNLPVHATNMIRGLAILLIFQSIGEVVTKFIHGVLPGPVIGMILLLAFLVARKKIAASIAMAADGLLAHLAIFFIPAAVGVMLYIGTLRSAGAAWLLAIVFSTVGAITVTALLLKWLTKSSPPDNEPAQPAESAP